MSEDRIGPWLMRLDAPIAELRAAADDKARDVAFAKFVTLGLTHGDALHFLGRKK